MQTYIFLNRIIFESMMKMFSKKKKKKAFSLEYINEQKKIEQVIVK